MTNKVAIATVNFPISIAIVNDQNELGCFYECAQEKIFMAQLFGRFDWRVSCPIQETLLKPKKFVIEYNSSPMFESNQTNPDVYDKKIRKLKCWLLKTLSASGAGH